MIESGRYMMLLIQTLCVCVFFLFVSEKGDRAYTAFALNIQTSVPELTV